MRIIAGNSKINILSDNKNNSDFILLAELVDSSMGYEKPVFVRNSRDLLIWFGDDFEDYKFLKEFLDKVGVSLYLYRKVETTDSEKVIIGKYFYIPDISPNTSETLAALEDPTCFWIEGADDNINLLPEVGEEWCLYKVILSDGIKYDPNYNIRYSYYEYNAETGSYVLCDSLDESLEIKSLQNRDRLSVGYYNGIGEDSEGHDVTIPVISYSYYNPGIDNFDYSPSVEITCNGVIRDFNKLQETVLSGHATRNLLTKYEGTMRNDTLKSDPYIPLYSTSFPTIVEEGILKKLTYFYSYATRRSVNNSNSLGDDDGDGVEDSFRDDLFFIDYIVLENAPGEIPTHLANDNFTSSIEEIDFSENSIYSTMTYDGLIAGGDSTVALNPNSALFIRYNEFYNMPQGFTVKPNFLKDQQDIYDFYVHNGEVYRFESKTIGKGSEDIKVEIRWIETYTEKNNIYSITISRYDYQEFYEGPLENELGVERLDHRISRESKLVRFKIIPTSKPEQGWPEGKWELKGAYEDEKTRLNTEYSFNLMCKTLEDFPPDFILIPHKEMELSEYKVLNWTKTLNCQALITNSTEDWISNIEDRENRLMYFYNTMKISGLEKPGYYVFLRSLLSSNTYLPSVSKLLYSFPEAETEEETQLLYENLKNKKSNYLCSNNHFYYYDYYFPGEDYETTPLVRFVISKITRELEKNKWKIIGEKATRISEDTLYPILAGIQNRFSIIRSIKITNFVVDGISRTVEASITTTLSDIISSDVSFDIILNYSKLNN